MTRLTALRLAVIVSLLVIFAGASIIASQKSAANMAKAATLFLDSLQPDQRTKVSFPFEGNERL